MMNTAASISLKSEACNAAILYITSKPSPAQGRLSVLWFVGNAARAPYLRFLLF
jgi:hypothetical protein